MEPIRVGHVTERGTRQHIFPVGNLMTKFPGCQPILMFQRPGSETAYPVASAVVDGGRMVWTFSETDTATEGDGFCWLVMIDETGERVWMTDAMPTHTDASYTAGQTPPDPVVSWIQRLMAVAAQVLNAEQSVAQSAYQAEQSAQAADASKTASAGFAAAAEHSADNAAGAAQSAAQQAAVAQQSMRDAAMYAGQANGSANAAHADAVAAYASEGRAGTAADRAGTAADRADKSADAARAAHETAAQKAAQADASANVAQEALHSIIGEAGRISVLQTASADHEQRIETLEERPSGEVTKEAIDAALGVDVVEQLGVRLTQPSSIKVGNYFRVASVDADGRAVLEAVDLPQATSSMAGVVKAAPWKGVEVASNGELRGVIVNNETYPTRGNDYIMSKGTLQNARQDIVRRSILSNSQITEADKPQICQTIGAERKWTDGWELKGVMTSPDDIAVDLTACTELAIIGTTKGTGSTFLRAFRPTDVYIAGYVSNNGNMSICVIIMDSAIPNGYYIPFAKYQNDDSNTTHNMNMTYTYNDNSGSHVSDIKKLGFVNKALITKCNLSIYAR